MTKSVHEQEIEWASRVQKFLMAFSRQNEHTVHSLSEERLCSLAYARSTVVRMVKQGLLRPIGTVGANAYIYERVPGATIPVRKVRGNIKDAILNHEGKIPQHTELHSLFFKAPDI